MAGTSPLFFLPFPSFESCELLMKTISEEDVRFITRDQHFQADEMRKVGNQTPEYTAMNAREQLCLLKVEVFDVEVIYLLHGLRGVRKLIMKL